MWLTSASSAQYIVGARWMVVVDVGYGEGSVRASRFLSHKKVNVRIDITLF